MAYKYSKGKTFQGDIYNEDDTQRNTYIDFGEDDYIGLVTSGSAVLVVSGSKVGIGTTDPSSRLHAYGSISSNYVGLIDNDGSSNAHGLKVTTDGTGTGTNVLDLESGTTTLFRVRGDGRVGIGKVTALPSAVLTVSGSNGDADIAVASKIQHIGDSDTYIEFSDDELVLAAGGRGFIKCQEDSTDKLMINQGALDIDLQVKGATDANLIRTDAANDRVGIGTSTPDYTLDVAGNIGVDQFIYHNGDADTYLNFTNNTVILAAGGNEVLSLSDKAVVNGNGDSIAFAVAADHGDHCIMADTQEGRVGILNSSPGTDFVVGQDTLIVSGSSVGIGSTWSGKELHVTDGDSSTSGAPTDSQVVVESGGNAGISLLAGGSRARIYFGDSSDIDEGIIEYKFTNNERYNLTVGGNEVMRIYESGYSNTITTLNGVKTTAGLFTEGHPYYSNDANITVGDCCVLENGQIVRSSSPMQKNVGGIAWYSVLDDLQDPGASGDEAWPLTLNDGTVSRVAEDALGVQCDMAEQSGGEWVPTAKFQTLWKLAAVGDSRQSNYGTTDLTGFKVCNEGGAIVAGDLLCTSTTPGYLMKQPDDIVRSYTVGKSMEDVTFDGNGQASGIYGYLYCG